MKEFNANESSWSSKVNFVDANNVFVGFDTYQSCCEDAGWYYTYNADAPLSTYGGEKLSEQDLQPYVFDANYVTTPEGDCECGGAVRFRLTASEKPDLYLVIYNIHNGYYAHGLEVKNFGGIEVPSSL